MQALLVISYHIAIYCYLPFGMAKGGVPSGSGNFKGSAGVLSKAIELLRDWAEKNKS